MAKSINEWVHVINWDCVIIDEYHYGAWRETAKDLFETDDKSEASYQSNNKLIDYNESNLPITANHYLYLSETPFRAIDTGEFLEEQILIGLIVMNKNLN